MCGGTSEKLVREKEGELERERELRIPWKGLSYFLQVLQSRREESPSTMK